jgi:gas vesicle protein
MADDNQKGAGICGICTAFGMGALMGAGLVLMLAPRSGSESRDLLSQKAKDLGDAADKTVAKGTHLLEEAGHKIASTVRSGERAIENAQAELQSP